MILLYIIGILCSLVLFTPASLVPIFVKWPVALGVVLIVILFFNIPKKDTAYTTHYNKKNIYNFGLFNPLIMYLSASCYVLGFSLIFSALNDAELVDIVSNLANIPSLISFNPLNGFTFGLIYIVGAILFYFLRNGFRSCASDSRIQTRSFWYIVLTLAALGVGMYYFITFYSFDIYEFLSTGLNLYIYFGLAGLIVLVDILFIIIAALSQKKKAKKVQEILEAKERGEDPLTKKDKKALKKEAKKQNKLQKKELKRLKKSSKKEAKNNKILEKEQKILAKKLAANEAKYLKSLAKLDANQAKVIAKLKK